MGTNNLRELMTAADALSDAALNSLFFYLRDLKSERLAERKLLRQANKPASANGPALRAGEPKRTTPGAQPD